MNQPSISKVKELDGKIFVMLTDQETEVLNYYRDRGRKFSVSVSIKNEADPKTLAGARSQEEADQIMKSANSRVSVTIMA